MIRGIGDPIVSIYARAYVCRVWLLLHLVIELAYNTIQVGMSIAPHVRAYVTMAFKDFLRVYPQVSMTICICSFPYFALQNETQHIKFLMNREKIGPQQHLHRD